eukprot:Sdes_comp18691_c0_seq1m8976
MNHASSPLMFCIESVVVKVGMVGDSQIGKTSLMVKYVEGSFDEDYIQTLGKTKSTPFFFQYSQISENPALFPKPQPAPKRRQLYGENHQHPKYGNHIQHLGSWRPARIHQHAAPRLQRFCRNSIHV